MQYQVDPTMQTPENGEKPHFWLYGSFKNAFPWCLNDPSWPGNDAESWKTFSTMRICNIKSIQQTKLRIMAKNLFFWHFGSFKNAFFVTFEWSNMCHIVEKLLRTFSIIKICNIKLIQWTKLEKTANNWMEHSNQPERVYPSNGKKCHGWSRFFPDMRFSRGGPRKALLSY